MKEYEKGKTNIEIFRNYRHVATMSPTPELTGRGPAPNTISHRLGGWAGKIRRHTTNYQHMRFNDKVLP